MIRHTKTVLEAVCKAAICLWNSAMGSQRKTNCKAAFLPEKSSICAGHRTQWCFVYRKPVLTPAATWIFSVPDWGFLALCVLFVFSCAGFLRYGERNHRFRYRLFNRAGGMVGQHAAGAGGKIIDGDLCGYDVLLTNSQTLPS